MMIIMIIITINSADTIITSMAHHADTHSILAACIVILTIMART